MKFEWDARKASINLEKHKIGFQEAATVFFDPNGLEIPDPEHSVHEVRALRLGISILSRVLLTVYTERGVSHGKQVIRIISARRANKKEKALYDRRVHSK